MKQEIDPKRLSTLYDAAKTYYAIYVSDIDLSEKDEKRWIYTLVDAYLFMETYLKDQMSSTATKDQLSQLKDHLSRLKK
jgi:hypothetical protein